MESKRQEADAKNKVLEEKRQATELVARQKKETGDRKHGKRR
jgi:hypothetical protein